MDIWSLTLWSFGRTSRGLLYVLIWEALLSNFVSGARLLSVSHYGLGIANGIAHNSFHSGGRTACRTGDL
jgi:ABC-2 type transport system permease protein